MDRTTITGDFSTFNRVVESLSPEERDYYKSLAAYYKETRNDLSSIDDKMIEGDMVEMIIIDEWLKTKVNDLKSLSTHDLVRIGTREVSSCFACNKLLTALGQSLKVAPYFPRTLAEHAEAGSAIANKAKVTEDAVEIAGVGKFKVPKETLEHPEIEKGLADITKKPITAEFAAEAKTEAVIRSGGRSINC